MAHENSAAQMRPELHVKVEESIALEDNFIADRMFPIFPVTTRTGDFMKIKRGKGQLLANPEKGGTLADPLKRAPGTAYREISRTAEKDGWKTVDRGLTEVVDDTLKQEASRFYDQEAATAIWLMRNVRIARESRVAALAFDPANWGKIDAAVEFTETNVDTFDFPAVMKAAQRTIRKRQEYADSLVISQELWDLIAMSKKLREYLFGTNGGASAIDERVVAEKFKLKNILIGAASYDTTKPGKDSTDENLVWTWSDRFFWVGHVQGGAPELGGAGRTLVLDELTNGQQYVTESEWNWKTRSTMIRVRQDDDTKVVNENSGMLVQVKD